ncbi:hypothetical protein Kisp01_37660 [Kineosporia sp. NBRC 101677]|uniref:TetR/AcrR family transcriptional regulator n=1 Tax=Kineosporia sp. NBRC 101677 TaxID=3032197 RepID=UPI0024A54443|nr:TetR/AcrR family transcriptional regulator [Kineosporia sp. NBRC 101677]GLY16751.1 hypothetical protein Kisp01_37660 [Kineosporia sp. NBRC 101677]
MARAGLNQEIVEATAAQLADQEGLAGLSLSAVARQLKVQSASLYVHVANRPALLAALHRRALGDLATRISHEIAGRSGLEALQGLAEAHRSLAQEHPGAWAALQQIADADTATSKEAAEVVQLNMAVLRQYDIAADETVHATRVIGSAINGFVSLELQHAFGHRDVDAEASFQRMVSALDRALRSWPS